MKFLLVLFTIVIFSSCICRKIPHEVPDRVEISPETSFQQIPFKEKEYYIVKKKDSLWKIAKMYNCSIEEIMRENKLTTKNLEIGQKIFIPASKEKTETSFLWPVKGKIIDSFGKNVNNITNKGVNIKILDREEVKASAGGSVIFSNLINGWGQTIIIKHPYSLYTVYANLSDILIKKGSYVRKGQTIAKGTSNNINGDCILHFEIRKKHLPQNPLYYLE